MSDDALNHLLLAAVLAVVCYAAVILLHEHRMADRQDRVMQGNRVPWR